MIEKTTFKDSKTKVEKDPFPERLKRKEQWWAKNCFWCLGLFWFLPLFVVDCYHRNWSGAVVMGIMAVFYIIVDFEFFRDRRHYEKTNDGKHGLTEGPKEGKRIISKYA